MPPGIANAASKYTAFTTNALAHGFGKTSVQTEVVEAVAVVAEAVEVEVEVVVVDLEVVSARWITPFMLSRVAMVTPTTICISAVSEIEIITIINIRRGSETMVTRRRLVQFDGILAALPFTVAGMDL